MTGAVEGELVGMVTDMGTLSRFEEALSLLTAPYANAATPIKATATTTPMMRLRTSIKKNATLRCLLAWSSHSSEELVVFSQRADSRAVSRRVACFAWPGIDG